MNITILMFRYLFLIIAIYLNPLSLSAKSLNIEGLSKFSMNDIQSITSVDIYSNYLNINDVNKILKELSVSELIYEVSYEDKADLFLFYIEESDTIEDIYIINNTWIKDDLIIQNLRSKNNSFLTKNKIQDDIKTIKNIYKSKGFQDISIISKVEKFSQDRVNLIYEIEENKQQKINSIKFVGNKFFSANYLNSIINSQSIKFYNFFKSGSNSNPDIFSFDRNKLINFYIENGFFDVDVSYEIIKNNFGAYSLTFFIKESVRYKVDKIDFEQSFENIPSFNRLYDNLILDLNKNRNYYSKNLITEFLETLNLSLIRSNINDYYVDIDINLSGSNVFLKLKKVTQNPYIIKHINIFGNSITKDKTIRSKLLIEPGDTYNQYLVNRSITNLEKFSYIKNVKIENNLQNNTTLDLTIDESKKTGNVLFAGTFNTDTQFGLTFDSNKFKILSNLLFIISIFFSNSSILFCTFI